MNVMGGVKVIQGGGEGPFVEIQLGGGFSERYNYSPKGARKLAARLYVAARAAERIAETTEPGQRSGT